jgi:hypothetical protein
MPASSPILLLPLRRRLSRAATIAPDRIRKCTDFVGCGGTARWSRIRASCPRLSSPPHRPRTDLSLELITPALHDLALRPPTPPCPSHRVVMRSCNHDRWRTLAAGNRSTFPIGRRHPSIVCYLHLRLSPLPVTMTTFPIWDSFNLELLAVHMGMEQDPTSSYRTEHRWRMSLLPRLPNSASHGWLFSMVPLPAPFSLNPS